MWLTRLALKNPVFILMLSLMTIALGWISLTHLAVDLFPEIDIPQVRVATYYTGAAPEDVEKSLTMPIERAVSATPGVDRVESVSKQGLSLVNVWFQYGINLDNAQFEVSQRVSQILAMLPSGVQQPFVIKTNPNDMPIVSVAMSSNELDQRQLYDLGYNVIEPQLERLPGVASATIAGGTVREIEVMVQRDALRARNLDILDVVGAVKASNLLLPSGNLKAGERNYNVFSNTQLGDARPLQDLVVRPAARSAGGTAPIRLRDVARVVDASADQTNVVRINGERGVFFRVVKQPGANTISVVDAVRRAIPRLRDVPPNVKLVISFDQSRYIRSAIGALQHEALQGGLLAIFVILVFLVSFSATGIIAVAIPLSIVATFVLLYFTGQTLNVFTLGGLALAVGRLVDDSIVELENIHRHLATGQNRREAVLNAAQEVAGPIFVSTVTTIVVFFPVVFLMGVAKNLFLPMALTISFALIVSFLVSRTVTPLLCIKYLRAHTPGGQHRYAAWITSHFDALDEAYGRALQSVLRHRGRVVGGIFAAFVVSLVLGRFTVGSQFFPDSDESQLQVTFKAPIGTRVELTEQVATRIEEHIQKTLARFKGADGKGIISALLSNSGLPRGRGGLFTSNTGPHSGQVSVNLVGTTQRPIDDMEATDLVRKGLGEAVPGTQAFFFTGGIVKRMLNFGAQNPIDVEILGYDLDVGGEYAKRLVDRLRTLARKDGRPLLTDLQVSREENYPELNVEVDREKAGTLGISEQQVAQTVLASLAGSTQFTQIPFIDSRTGNQYDINVRNDDRFRSNVSDLGDIYLRPPAGNKLVALANIATVKRSSGPVTISRKYLQRIIDVTANLAPGVDLGSASVEVEKAIREIPPPDGFSAKLGGQTAAQREAFSGLFFAAVLAVALVYMILASQFRSLLDPLVIMFSVPMGITGVILMLAVTGTPLSVNSFMGIIMMVGIVVSNGVLLVDFARVLQSRGKPLIEATVEAGKTRLRPILMTTIATIFGLLPMAFGFGEGSETNLPLARAVIGGLSISTVFTLFLIPALYTYLERFSRHREAEGTETTT